MTLWRHLANPKKLLACLNTHVIPGALADINDQVITLSNAEGEPQAIVCAIPYLRPRDILHSEAGQSGSDKQQSLQQAISDHFQKIYALAEIKQTEIKKDSGLLVPIIATGHLTTVGLKAQNPYEISISAV